MFCVLDPIGENYCAFAEACKKDKVINSEIFSEGDDVSFENFHEYSLHSYFEGKFDCGEEGKETFLG